MQHSTFQPWSGVAGILSGLLFILVSYAVAYVHGSTTENQRLRLFSLTGDDYARLGGIAWLLALFLMVGIYLRFRQRVGRLGRIGLTITLVSLVLIVLASGLTSWITRLDVYWEQHGGLPWYAQIGYVLGVLAQLPLALGLVLLGIALYRAKIHPTWWQFSFLVMGIWVPVAMFLSFLIPNISDGTLAWDIVFGSIGLPISIGWILLGVLLWSEARDGV